MSGRRSPALALLLVGALVRGGCAGLMGDSIETLLAQGVELLNARKYDEAATKFLEVVRRAPTSWNAYLYLARAYVGKGSWSDAIASARKALDLAPGKTEVLPTLAEAFLGAGTDALGRRQFSEAAGHFVDYLKLRPTDAQGYLQLGRAFLGTGAYADAARAFVQGLGQSPDAGGRQALLGGLLDGGGQALSAGHAGAAAQLLQEYVRHDAGNVGAYLSLGKAYWQGGEVGSAFAAFRRVLELSPGNAEALQFLGGRR
jgi:cytochrome c-type biogenesis protein CcmH/NrfG